MLAKGLNPLPDFVPTEDGPTAAYPLHIINWKEALHTHSRTMNNRWLMEFHGENELWININKAKTLGIGDSDMVTVVNQYGKALARAKVTRRIHTDVVGLVHGFGHWAGGTIAKRRERTMASSSRSRPNVSPGWPRTRTAPYGSTSNGG